MFKKLSNWWNRDEIERNARLDALEVQQALLAAHATEVEKQLEEATQEVNMYRARDEADDANRNGTDPWIEIKSADFDPVRGIHIELDWNVAFVQHLKDNGFKARDDETLVQKWLAFLYEDLINRLEQKVIDASDKPRVNDFE